MKNKSEKNPQTKSALVLSGGGALGIAHLGAISALMKQGYSFDWYAGVSAGAIVAAGLAVGYSPDELKKKILETKLMTLAFDFSWKKGGLLSGAKVRNVLDDIFGDKTFEELKTPLIIGATDYATGDRINICSGKITDAIQASLSVPLLFTPFFHPTLNCYCVDGGLSHNFPIDLAVKQYQGDKIIGIDVNTSLPALLDEQGNLQKLSVPNNLQRVFKVFFRNQFIPADPRLIIIRPELSLFTSFDIFKLEGMWQAGYDSTISPEK